MRNLIILMASMLLFGCESEDEDGRGRIVDVRDGKSYATIKIGGTNWMAEDLRWNDQEGYHYHDALRACPEGWQLPTSDEWRALGDHSGGYLNYSDRVGDPNEAFVLLTDPEGFNSPEEGFYWSSTPALFDVATLRSETSFLGNISIEGDWIFGIGWTIKTSTLPCRCVEREKLIPGSFEVQTNDETLNFSSHFEYFIQWDTAVKIHAFDLESNFDEDWMSLTLIAHDLQYFASGEVQVPGRVELLRTETIEQVFSNGRIKYSDQSVDVTLTRYEEDGIEGYFQATLRQFDPDTEAIEIVNSEFSLDLSALN